MPARHVRVHSERRVRVHSEQGLPYTPLSVHPVAHRNGSARSDSATTAFVPLWLLCITGDVCSITKFWREYNYGRRPKLSLCKPKSSRRRCHARAKTGNARAAASCQLPSLSLATTFPANTARATPPIFKHERLLR
jgi:hypothetical protein